MSERTYAEFAAAGYDRKLATIVAGLRSLADRIEREGKPRPTPSFDGTPRYTNAAQQVIHGLFWGFANLNADGLLIEASHADRAEAADDDQ